MHPYEFKKNGIYPSTFSIKGYEPLYFNFRPKKWKPGPALKAGPLWWRRYLKARKHASTRAIKARAHVYVMKRGSLATTCHENEEEARLAIVEGGSYDPDDDIHGFLEHDLTVRYPDTGEREIIYGGRALYTEDCV